MVKKNIFSCKCGAIVKVLSCPSGKTECDEMIVLKENNVDASLEKHVPILKKINGGYKVIVGELNHPMISEHYIEWIELNEENNICQIKFLKPGDNPEAIFKTESNNVWIRSYCNLHGLWKSK